MEWQVAVPALVRELREQCQAGEEALKGAHDAALEHAVEHARELLADALPVLDDLAARHGPAQAALLQAAGDATGPLSACCLLWNSAVDAWLIQGLS